jgi:cell wall-associated NlpC family hydrolase
LIRRIMALTSSVLFAAGTTPWPMGGHVPPSTSTAKTGGLKPGQTSIRSKPESDHGYDGADALSITGMLRRQYRLNEVHYAVANNTVVPIVQDQLIWKALKEQQRKWLEGHTARPGTQKPGSNHRTTRRLSARSGGVSIFTPTHSFGIHIAKIALSLVGTPYRWGGTSEAGFDCSGFAQYVFRKLGTVLPRTTYEQFSGGTAVSRSSLRPGDLVFFTTDRAGASHVAVYIGNGLIVHALNARTGVIVSRLSDAYYASRYIGARRYCN